MTLSNEFLKQNFINLINSNLNFNIKSKNLNDEKLLPQELHIKIENKKVSIIRKHEFQDKLRITFFLNFLINSLNLIGEELNCEFIANLSEGIDDECEIKRFCYAQKKD